MGGCRRRGETTETRRGYRPLSCRAAASRHAVADVTCVAGRRGDKRQPYTSLLTQDDSSATSRHFVDLDQRFAGAVVGAADLHGVAAGRERSEERGVAAARIELERADAVERGCERRVPVVVF